MDDNSLGNFRSDVSNLSDDEETGDADIQASMYHQEINTLKIEKLSQRITIISVIIPCIIIAILAFAYIDMKERVVDVDQTQGSQVAKIAKALEEKLNALDVRIAKATFDLDEKLALIEKKSQALENQAARMSSTKADSKSVEKALAKLAKLEKQIKANAGQDKSTLAAMERINRQLQAGIKENNVQFKSKSDQIKDEIQLFKEEFDARLLELSAYEQQIAELTKTTSLYDKKLKTLNQEIGADTDKKLAQVRQALERKIKAAAASPVAAPAKPKASTPKAPAAPAPQPAAQAAPKPPASQGDSGISEENLTE